MTNHTYLNRVQRPTRYLGREINAVFKDPRAVEALIFTKALTLHDTRAAALIVLAEVDVTADSRAPLVL